MKEKTKFQRFVEVTSTIDKSFKPKLNEDMYSDDQITQNFDKRHVNEPDIDFDKSEEDISVEELISASEEYVNQMKNHLNRTDSNNPNYEFFANEIKNTEKVISTLKQQSSGNEMSEKYNKWGKSQDAWADIETGGEASRAKERMKQSYNNREVGSGSGSSHVPEYYNTYDREEPIPNTNNLTQGEIDAMNDKARDRMDREVRGAMSRGDDHLMEQKTKFQRLVEVMSIIDKSFKPKLNENEISDGDFIKMNFSNKDEAEDYIVNYSVQAKDEGNSNKGFVRKYVGRHPQGNNILIFEDGEILIFDGLYKGNTYLQQINFQSSVN